MPEKRRKYDRIRVAALFAGIALPTLTLIPIGSIWLWQHGYLLIWAVAAMVCVAVAFFVQQYFLPAHELDGPGVVREDSREEPDKSWTPAELDAWRAIEDLARRTDASSVDSRDAVLDLGVTAIRLVATRMHPEVRDPLFQFTLPEAFALTERVSRRLRRFTTDNVPLGDRLTVANALAVYRWRGAVDVAEKAYNIWRIARFANPMAAATHELRERMSKQIVDAGRTHFADRLVKSYVKEVGRAAIDLYGGRLRIAPEELQANVSPSSEADALSIAERSNEPLRILVCGQTGSGKSSLVNALAGELHAAVDALPVDGGFTPYRIQREGLTSALLIDSPGLDGRPDVASALVKAVKNCDLLIYVVSASRADRQIDRNALDQIRAAFAAMPKRRLPPIVAALTHIDRLRPFQEWNPPYDLNTANQPKAASIKSALEATANDLALGIGDIVPVSLRPSAEYNVDAVWACIADRLPDAQRAKLIRQLNDMIPNLNLKKVWSQAIGAGRILGRSFQK